MNKETDYLGSIPMKNGRSIHFVSGRRMKTALVMAAAACCGLAGFTLEAAEFQNDPLNAVVRVEAVSTEPNFTLPWQNRMPISGHGSGVVIKGKQILTNAHNVADSSLITIRKQNEDTLFVAKVKFVNHECDLALLTDPTQFDACVLER